MTPPRAAPAAMRPIISRCEITFSRPRSSLVPSRPVERYNFPSCSGASVRGGQAGDHRGPPGPAAIKNREPTSIHRRHDDRKYAWLPVNRARLVMILDGRLRLLFEPSKRRNVLPDVPLRVAVGVREPIAFRLVVREKRCAEKPVPDGE